MNNIRNKIFEVASTVPRKMYGCCNWGGLPGDYLVSTHISKLVMIKLGSDGENFDHIFIPISTKVANIIHNK